MLRPRAAPLLDARIVLRLGNQQGLAVLRHPAGHSLAHLHAQIAQRHLFSARGNRIVELLARFIHHQQRPQLCLDEPFHLLDDGAQNRFQIAARGQRARYLVEDFKVV